MDVSQGTVFSGRGGLPRVRYQTKLPHTRFISAGSGGLPLFHYEPKFFRRLYNQPKCPHRLLASKGAVDLPRNAWRTGLAGVCGRLIGIAWAAAMGASDTLRLWCTVTLTSAAAPSSPLAASCFVTACGLFLSAAFMVPSTSLGHLPRRRGPWLAGLSTLPAFPSLVAASMLGLGLTQMTLRFSLLAFALALDAFGGKRKAGIVLRVCGAFVVLLGVAAGLSSRVPAAGPALPPLGAAACALAALVAGACFVLQARLLRAGPTPAAPSEERSAQTSAATDALVCQLVNASVHLPILLLFGLGGVSFSAPRLADWHLWLFTGLQGVFYLRSLQVLPARLGYSTFFALSLCGQLVTALLLDAACMGVAVSPARVLSLGLVVAGAAISASA